MLFPRFLRSAVLSLLLALMPVTAGASSVPLPESAQRSGAVSRAIFLRAAVQAVELPTPAGRSPTGAYGRPVPKALAPFAAAAEKREALEALGGQVHWSRPVTRGEAVQIMVALTQAAPAADAPRFADVPRGSALEEAVGIAVERQWMRPVRATRFGTDLPLSGRDALQLLERASGKRRDPASLPVIQIQILPPQIAGDDLLETVRQLLGERYLYRERLQDIGVGYEDARDLVESLDDPYTVYMPPADAREFQVQLEGEVTGIGAQVEMIGDVLTIVSPLTGSPAEKAGLRGGDHILGVDNQSIRGMTLLEAVSKVRGPRGSHVMLRIGREGREFDVTVTRDLIQVPEIEIGVQDGIAVVKLVQFGQITDTKLRALLARLQEEHRPRGLILDLRNNPGGLLHAAEIVLSNFLPEGTGIARILSRDAAYTQVTVDPPTIDPGVRMAVLVNRGSASASEIVAGALQDAKRATVIGEQTFGKGTVQQIIEFRDGSSIKMTIAEWRTPADRPIDGVGVTPDVTVLPSADRDAPLQRALELLR